jgi:hypothetical protein
MLQRRVLTLLLHRVDRSPLPHEEKMDLEMELVRRRLEVDRRETLRASLRVIRGGRRE